MRELKRYRVETKRNLCLVHITLSEYLKDPLSVYGEPAPNSNEEFSFRKLYQFLIDGYPVHNDSLTRGLPETRTQNYYKQFRMLRTEHLIKQKGPVFILTAKGKKILGPLTLILLECLFPIGPNPADSATTVDSLEYRKLKKIKHKKEFIKKKLIKNGAITKQNPKILTMAAAAYRNTIKNNRTYFRWRHYQRPGRLAKAYGLCRRRFSRTSL